MLKNRISSSKILSMARSLLEAGLTRLVHLRKLAHGIYFCFFVCLISCSFFPFFLAIFLLATLSNLPHGKI